MSAPITRVDWVQEYERRKAKWFAEHPNGTPEQFALADEQAATRAWRDECQSELSDRLSKGRYNLEEAAILIGKKAGERADEMLKKLLQAVRDGALAVHEPNKQARYQSDTVREYYEEAYWNDLNDWLVANESRIAWRFPDPGGNATDNRPKWEIPGRPEYVARQIGEQWMLAEEKKTGKRPGLLAIAKYTAGELSNPNRNIKGTRGKFWDAETIKREVLTGITGRPPNRKRVGKIAGESPV